MKKYNIISTLTILFIGILTLNGCENYAERTHESWVTPPPGIVYDDSTIYARIIYAVQSDSALQGTDIKIKVNDGKVVLTGTVNNQDQITRMNMHSWIVDGVKSVNNQLIVN